MFLLLLACTAPEKDTVNESVSTSEALCPPGSHAGTDACEATLSGWSSAPALKNPRDHHVSVLADVDAGPTLFTLGGTNKTGGTNLYVERALIGDDGTLQDWEDAGKLPAGRIGPGMAQVGNSLVVAGGLLGDSNSTGEAWVVQIQPDGSLTFTDAPALGTTRYHVAMAYENGFVYATGGLNQVVGNEVSQEVLSSIERATFDGTTLGRWEEIGALPEATTHHGLVVYEHALYLFGGGDGTRARTTVLRSAIAEDGSLGAWMEVGDMPAGRASPAVTVFLDQVYVIAGMTGLATGEVGTVLRGRFEENGTVGEWEELPELPMARAHSHQAPFYNGVIYSLGGSIDHVDQSEVFAGVLQ